MPAAAADTRAYPCSSVLLMNGALERIAQARRRMAAHAAHPELAEQSRLLHTATSLIDELRGGLDLHSGGVLAAHLDDLYDYLARRLAAADRHSDPEILDQVADLLQEVRTAWPHLPPYARGQRVPAPAIKE
jgi:flagellar secretion chaperone FliS